MPPEMTEESTKNLASAINELNKNLEKTNATYLEISSNTKDIEKNVKDTNKEIEKKGSKLLDGLYNTLDKMVESSESIVGIVTGGTLIASLGTIAKHSWDINDSMTKLAVRMGQGKKGVKDLEGSVTGMMKSFGSNYDQAKDIVTTLAQAKYADNLQEAAEGADLFSRATGVTVGTVVQLTDALNKQAGVSTKTSNAILAGMTKVQQTVGISYNGMEALASSINDMALNMAAFGKTNEDIKRAAINTTALAGAMEKVGVSAQRAVALMDQLSDPDRIEDNILLYSQLGISIEDALNGGVQEALEGDAFKEMGERIAAMGPIAGSAMAKSMGLSYKEVTRMAQMETGSMNDLVEGATVEEDKALDKLDEFVKETEGLGAKIKRFFNQMEGRIMGLGPIIVTALTVVAPQILKLFKGLIEKITGRGKREGLQASVETSVNDAIENIEKKGRGLSFRFAASGLQKQADAKREGVDNAQRHLADSYKLRDSILNTTGENGERLINEDGARNEDASLSLADKRLQDKLIKQYKKVSGNIGRWEKAASFSSKAQENLYNKQKKLEEIQDVLNKSTETITASSKRISELKEIQKNANDEMKKIIQEQIEAEEKNLNSAILKQKKSEELVKTKQKEVEAAQTNVDAENKVTTKGSVFVKIGQGVASRVGTVKQKAANYLREEGGGSIGKGLGKTAGKALLGISKSIGPIAIVMGIMSKILDKVKEPLSNLADNLISILGPWLEPMLKTFVDLLNTMAKTLLPPVLYVLSGLLDALHLLLTPLIWLLKSLEKIPVVGKTLAGVGDMLDSITGSGGDLRSAAKAISSSNKDLTKAVDENTQTTEEANNEPATIEVVGGEAVMTSGQKDFVNSTVGSTTQNTQTVVTDEEKNKEANKETREKAQVNELSTQTSILKDEESHLARLVRLVEELLSKVNVPSFSGQTFTSFNGDRQQ